MKITYANQTIDLFDKNTFPNGPPNKIIVSLSGGLDSASLMYLIATHFPKIEIYPFNSKDEDGPLDTKSAIKIHKFLQNKFPDGKINDLELFDVKTSDPKWIKIAQEAMDSPKGKIIINGKTETIWRTVKGASKAIQCRHIRINLTKKYNTVVATGMSQNPPIKEMKELGFYDVAERKRDPDKTSNLSFMDGITYTPYIFVDKKFVADIYIKNNLMEELYPLTKSCAWGISDGNINYPDPCGKCFWCNEKKWAFNRKNYD